MLDYITIEPRESANASIIWLHGLGADGHDFADLPAMLHLPTDIQARFIFPHAPMIPVTSNQGYVMRAWFDIIDIAPDGIRDVAGMDNAMTEVYQLIAQEHQRGIPAERIIIGGFSQGGATVLMTGLKHADKIAGIACLSGFLPDLDVISSSPSVKLPCFLAHGTQDPIVPLTLGTQTAELLAKAGFPVTWHEYRMTHQVCPEEMQALRTWMVQWLGASLS